MSEETDPHVVTITQGTKVGWFDVRQLFATSVKVLTSTIVSSMSGRRELVAALDPAPRPFDYLEKRRFG
ncbi:MAG: hypothetical protein J2P49_01365 [Methylocapsa sp.]|nr:hypothetical protein [Methylocapsa sp.]